MSENKGRPTMFRRKDEDTQEELDVMTEENPNKPRSAAPAQHATSEAGGARPANRPAAGAPASGFRPQGGAPAPRAAAPGAPAPRAAAPQHPGSIAQDQRQAPAKANSKRILTVGNDILLKGEIATCDRLVIEGMVDATLKDVHTVEISESGSFKGTAEIQDAEISGLFEGDLVVHNRLTIYSTGKVRGKISYGEIEIERGGQMTGEIQIVGEVNPKGKKAA